LGGSRQRWTQQYSRQRHRRLTANAITLSNLTAGTGSTVKFDLTGGIASNLRAGSLSIGSGAVTVEVSGTRGNQLTGNRVLLGNSTTALTNIGTPAAANQALLGNGTLTKTGDGVLTLQSSTSAGSFSGTIAVTGGTLRIAGADVLDGTAAGAVSVAVGAGIDYAVTLDATRLGKIAAISSGGVERWSSDSPRVSNTTSYTVPNGAILQIGANQTAGAGRTLTLGAGSVIEPFTTGSNSGNIGGNYNLNLIPIILTGDAFLGRSGTLSGLAGNNVVGGTGALTGSPEIRHIGAISGGFGLTKQGADVYTLGSAGNLSTYTGLTTISGGTLRLNATDAIKTGNNLTVNSTGNSFGYNSIASNAGTYNIATPGFDLAGFNQTIGTLNGSGSIGNLSRTTDSILTVASGTYSGALTQGSAVANSLSPQYGGNTGLTKTGAGTLSLTATNSHGAGTAINGGILAITSDANLGAATGTLNVPVVANTGTGYNLRPHR
jgi:fibronectin-binding autotransporter adhesin